MKCIEIEEAVARMFDYRRHLAIVPNISHGLGIHECDLLVVRNTGYAVEVEIKVSLADLKADAKKSHGHQSGKIKELYFAIPETLLEKGRQYIPDGAGIIIVNNVFRPHYGGSGLVYHAHIHRPAVPRKHARALTGSELMTVVRLGAMRIWDLKGAVIRLNNRIAELKSPAVAGSD